MRSVRLIPTFENIPIVVRAAMNEPVEKGIVQDTFRLARAASTLTFLQERRARVVVISHIGEAGTETLEPVVKALGQFVSRISFCPETIGPRARDAIRAMHPGDVLVLENLRRNRGEVMNDPEFAKELAQLGDVFVEDSFDTCHRKHASIIGLPKLLPSYAGFVVEQEVTELTKALSPKSSSLAIIGGAKFSTKEAVLKSLVARYDKVFIGGALASDFFRAQGHPVGASIVSPDGSESLKELLANKKVILPMDSVVAPQANPTLANARVASLDDVRPDEMILDHGPATRTLLKTLVEKQASILWNGPLGHYESGFIQTTDELAHAIANSGAYSVVGGGDTITSIEKLGILDRFSFLSTGGGAMLDFLADGALPGITALS